MKIIPFRHRRADRALKVALAIFQALRPGVDAPTAVLETYPDLNSDELFEAFSQAHHVLNNLQRAPAPRSWPTRLCDKSGCAGRMS